jgi:hypothetical protein
MKKKRRVKVYRGYLAQEDFERFCAAVMVGPAATRASAKVVLGWLAGEKKALLKQAKMIAELMERYGAKESP